MIFCRTNFDVDNLEQYLTGLGGGKACAYATPSPPHVLGGGIQQRPWWAACRRCVARAIP
jgi:hypothetical protein